MLQVKKVLAFLVFLSKILIYVFVCFVSKICFEFLKCKECKDASYFKSVQSRGRITLLHRRENRDASDYIYKRLSRHFEVFYSGAGGLVNGDDVVPVTEINTADINVFLHSKESMYYASISKREFKAALRCKKEIGTPLFIIKLDDTPLETLDGKIYNRFSCDNRDRDMSHIINDIKCVLDKRAHIHLSTDVKCRDIPSHISSMRPDELVKYLENRKFQTIFPLNFIFKAVETEKIIKTIRGYPNLQQDNIVDRLISIYLNMENQAIMAKENSLYIVGQLRANDKEILRTFNGRIPGLDTQLLYRGFHVTASSLGGIGEMEQYVRSLAFNTSDNKWERQRTGNGKFTILYYDGIEGALWQLRESIRTGSPHNLLLLNIFTLGQLSKDKNDVYLLEENALKFCESSVSKQILSQTINRINDEN